MFGAVFNWVAKTAGSLSYFVGGLALVAVGFNADLGGNQSEDAFLGMRLCMVLGGMIPNMIAFALLRFYPITKENAAETSRLLEERRGTVA
jgi:Na+/melibiose symporter-like transporter